MKMNVLKYMMFFLFLLISVLLICFKNFSTRENNSSEFLDNYDEKIHICFAIDEQYVQHLAVTLTSILHNTKRNVHFHVLSTDISEKSKRLLEKLKTKYDFDIDYVRIDKITFKSFPKGDEERITVEANYRLLIPNLLPQLKKVIYLDTDIILNGDIARLWDIDIGDNYIAAVPDQVGRRDSSDNYVLKFGLSKETQYINSGVLVMNLVKLRQDKMVNKFFDIAKKYKEDLHYVDQDILSIACDKKIYYLKHYFNAMPIQNYIFKEEEEEAFSNPLIIHWAGWVKPWSDREAPYIVEYNQYEIIKNNIFDLDKRKDIKIFVAFHEPYFSPISDVLIPIHVGRSISQDDWGWIADNTGNNISHKNPYYCELTATYWIWKNVKADIVGLYHYRRYFNLKSDSYVSIKDNDFVNLTGNNTDMIRSLMTEYDIILPIEEMHDVSVYEFFAHNHPKEGIDTLLEVIKEKYPEQFDIAYNTLHNWNGAHYTNMLITKKEIFDDYASWLFDILFEVEKRIQGNVEKEEYKRLYGHISERMMKIYVNLHPELRVMTAAIVGS